MSSTDHPSEAGHRWRKKGYRRYQRVGDSLRQVIAEAIERQIDDSRVGLITVTRVDAAPDLKTARVYISALGGEGSARAAEALTEHAGHIQREISRQIRIMWTPKLTFIADDAPERADHITRVLDELERGWETPETGPASEEDTP